MVTVHEMVNGPHHMLTNFKIILVNVLLVRQLVPADFLPIRSRKCFGVRLRLPRNTALRHAQRIASHTVACLRGGPCVTCMRGIAKDDPHMNDGRTHDRLAIVLGP